MNLSDSSNFEFETLQPYFQQASQGDCFIWGKKAKYIEVQNTNYQGEVQKSKLLIR